MTQAAYRKAEPIQLMTQAAFQGTDSESTHDSSGSPSIDSDRFMTQVTFKEIDLESTHDLSRSQALIQIDSCLKRKTFDSESSYDSTPSRSHVC